MSLAPTVFDRMTALADSTRSRMLLLLERHELTVGELCAVLQLPQSTASRHLRILADDGWVVSRSEGTSRLYSLPPLDSGAKRLWVLMEHTTKDGRPKVVERCGYPLSGLACVTRVYTNLAVMDVVPGRGFVVREMAPGVDLETLQSRSAARLHLDA